MTPQIQEQRGEQSRKIGDIQGMAFKESPEDP